jgi:hypothetical protein
MDLRVEGIEDVGRNRADVQLGAAFGGNGVDRGAAGDGAQGP